MSVAELHKELVHPERVLTTLLYDDTGTDTDDESAAPMRALVIVAVLAEDFYELAAFRKIHARDTRECRAPVITSPSRVTASPLSLPVRYAQSVSG